MNRKGFKWSLIHFIVLGVLMLFCAISVAWSLLRTLDEPQRHIDFKEKIVVKTNKPEARPKLCFAVAGMVSPKNTFVNYKKVVEMIGDKVDHDSSLMIHSSYRDVRKALQTGTVDVAFVCTGTFVLCVSAKEVEIIAEPVFTSTTNYCSVIIVSADSPVNSIKDLKGKSFAFTDPESCTGDFLPRNLFSSQDIDVRKFFSKTIYTGSHDKSIMAVAGHVVDAAAVDSLILHGIYPDIEEQEKAVKIIWKSDAYGPPPIVVPVNCNKELKKSLQEVFLDLHNDSDAEQLLKNIGITHFKKPNILDYKSILNLYKKKRGKEAGKD